MTEKAVPPRLLTPQMKIDDIVRRLRILESRKGSVGSPPGSPAHGIPPGGDTGDLLTKLSDTDFDANWLDPAVSALAGTICWNSHPDEIPDGALSVPFVITFAGTFTNVRASCGISPSGGAATFDVTKNGTTILPSSVSIASGGTLSSDVTPSVTTFVRDDVLQVVCGAAHNVLDVILYIDLTRTP